MPRHTITDTADPERPARPRHAQLSRTSAHSLQVARRGSAIGGKTPSPTLLHHSRIRQTNRIALSRFLMLVEPLPTGRPHSWLGLLPKCLRRHDSLAPPSARRSSPETTIPARRSREASG